MPQESAPETGVSPLKFVSELWAAVPADWYIEFNLLQYRPTLENPSGLRVRARFYPAGRVRQDWPTIAQELDHHNRTQVENIHHAVNPRFRQPVKGYGKNEDVSHFVALWVDVDFHGNEEAVRKQFNEAIEDLRSKGLGPSCIIESGHGLHAYWFLDKLYSVAEARPCCAGIQDYFKVSDAINDPRRILRMPGTLNLKDPKNPAWCRITEATWERFPLERFKEYAVPVKQTQEEKDQEKTRQETFTFSRDPEVERIKAGPIKEGERHTAALKIVGHYCAKLKAKKQVAYVARDWNDQKCVPPMDAKELDRIVEDLWAKEQIKRAEEVDERRAERDERKRRDESAPPRPSAIWFDEEGAFNPAAMAGYLCQEHKWIATPIGKDGRGVNLYIYKDGAYRPGGFDFLRREIVRLLGRDSRTKRIEEVIDLVTEFSKKPYEETNKEALVLINVKNGMLNWRTGELLPHDPKYHSLIQVPVEWKPDIESETLNKFLTAVVPADEIPVLEEFAGYLLIPDTGFAKCLVFVGEGGNGKSTVLRLTVSLVGKHNCTFYSLHSIAQDKFTAAGLVGSLVNFHDELESHVLENTGIFKQIVSGDPIKAEEKQKAPFWFKPFCRLVFATNQMPRATDRSQAYFDRLLFLQFPNRIRGSQQEIRDYDVILSGTPGVMEALLRRAVEGLRRLHAQGRFTASASAADAIEEYRRECSSAYDFLRECCDTSDPNPWIARKVLYEHYKAWSGDSGRKPMSEREFTKTVRGANVREVRHGKSRGWGGLRWADDLPPVTSEAEVRSFGEKPPPSTGNEGSPANLLF